jgi:hypothetical protein
VRLGGLVGGGRGGRERGGGAGRRRGRRRPPRRCCAASEVLHKMACTGSGHHLRRRRPMRPPPTTGFEASAESPNPLGRGCLPLGRASAKRKLSAEATRRRPAGKGSFAESHARSSWRTCAESTDGSRQREFHKIKKRKPAGQRAHQPATLAPATTPPPPPPPLPPPPPPALPPPAAATTTTRRRHHHPPPPPPPPPPPVVSHLEISNFRM